MLANGTSLELTNGTHTGPGLQREEAWGRSPSLLVVRALYLAAFTPTILILPYHSPSLPHSLLYYPTHHTAQTQAQDAIVLHVGK